MSDSVRPHRQQPTRMPRPWDSPGKNTGVGCHFLLQCIKVKSESKVAQSCPTLSNPMDCSLPGSSIHGIFQARVLEWGAIAFSRGSSWSRDQTQVSCMAGRFFTTKPPEKPNFNIYLSTMWSSGQWWVWWILWDFSDKNTEVGCHFLLQGLMCAEIEVHPWSQLSGIESFIWHLFMPCRRYFLIIKWQQPGRE